MNIVSRLLPSPSTTPDTREALVFRSPSRATRAVLTYAELRHEVARWTALIRQRCAPGERVVLALPHGLDFALAWLGTVAAGAVAVALSPQLSPRERDWIEEDTAATLILMNPEDTRDGARDPSHDAGAPSGDSMPRPPRPSDPGLAKVTLPPTPQRLTLREARSLAATLSPSPPLARDPDDPAFLVYTSGSSGQPKGVLHAHRSIDARRWMDLHWTGFHADDRILHSGELNWTYTLGLCLLDTLRHGATAILVERPAHPRDWGRIALEEDASLFAAVPSLYARIARHGGFRDFHRLRTGLCAGEPLPTTLLQRWQQEAGTSIYEALGMSECSTYVSSGPTTPTRPGSPGRIQAGRMIRLLPLDGGTDPVAPGETGILSIHRSDPGLMLRYWNADTSTDLGFREEWFLTGDLASSDADGYLQYHGRHDTLLNISGYRLSPEEIESTLRMHPLVEDALVGGEHIREDLTLLAARVVPRSPELCADTLAKWAAARLAGYKVPRRWHLSDEIPRTPRGKRDRKAAFPRE